MEATFRRPAMATRQVTILGFVKTHITETVAIVAFPDGRLTEARLHELTLCAALSGDANAEREG